MREHAQAPAVIPAIDPEQGIIPETAPDPAATTAIDPGKEASATGHHSAGSAAIDPVTATDPDLAATPAIDPDPAATPATAPDPAATPATDPDPAATPAIDPEQGVFDLQSPGSVAIGQEREETRATGQEVVWSVIGLAAMRIVPGLATTWESATGRTSATT